jgi:hypothetical protein
MNAMGLTHNKYLVDKLDGRAGTGDWENFPIPLELIETAAAEWKQQLAGVQKPWLCWCVNDRWCLLQQSLVLEVGWTPVIGVDPRIECATVIPGAIRLDFNRHFQLPVMWPHFPLEFAFLWAPKLAFWHSDLLCRLDKLKSLARTFEELKDGEMAAVLDRGGMRNLLNFKRHRYWELVCCTTRGASRDQFERGAGWWRHIECHPSCKDPAERSRRAALNWDSGIGIMYWKRSYGGRVRDLGLRELVEGHCTAINHKGYRFLTGSNVYRPIGDELEANFDLKKVAKRFRIDSFLS